MDIERLTKSQTVLLTLLVSFVTSIATGIVTVSLMEQAPPVIPQTINRVVERTVEKVVPQETQVATVITQEKTVTIKETDLVAQAVARTRGSVVRVHGYSNDTLGAFLSRGVVVADGYVVVQATGLTLGAMLAVVSGESFKTAKVVTLDVGHNLALIAVNTEQVTPAAFGTSAVVLGQSVIALSGSSGLSVDNGIVTSVAESEGGQASFAINIKSTSLVPGSVITNMDGAVIGLYTGDAAAIVPAATVVRLIKSLSEDTSQGNSGGSATSTKEKNEQ